MTDPTLEGCIENAEKYLEASYDESKELRFLAIRAAIGELIEALKIIHLFDTTARETQ